MMGKTLCPVDTTPNSGIDRLTCSLVRHAGLNRIRVRAPAPTVLLTDGQMDLWAKPLVLAAHLDQRWLKAPPALPDIVDAALFLASDSNWVATVRAMIVGDVVAVKR
jgi:hypothetical protein